MAYNLGKRLENANPQGAYTGGSADNQWTRWFGAQKSHIKTTPYDAKDRSTWVLPEGLGGSNLMLSNTLELMSFMVDSWYTQEALPIETTQKTGAKWSSFVFMPKFASLVPERGVARLVSSRRTEGRATFERRGIGLLLTHGFMNTPDGRESYLMNLRQIAQSVTETNNFGVIYAYLTADDYEKKWDKKHGTYADETLDKVLKMDTYLWDIMKRKNGPTLLDSEISSSMEKYRGKANMYIMPPKIGRYYTIVPSNRTDYWLAGPKGPASIYDGVGATRELSELSGNTIYLTRTYDVEPHDSKYGRAIDILRFNAQIGEYHLAFDSRRGGDYTDYKSSWRSIQVYDEDVDNFTTLSLNWMLKHCNRFSDNGEVMHVNDPEVAKHYPKFSKRDQAKDVFHYMDSKKRLQSASFIGNMEHLGTSDVFEWVETLLNRMPDVVLPTNGSDGNNNSYSIWTNGLRALKDIEAIRYNSDVNDWFKDLATKNKGFDVHDGTRRFRNLPPSVRAVRSGGKLVSGLKEFKPNPWGGLVLPEAGRSGITLPPGFGNYPGFKTIKNAVLNGTFEDLGYNQSQGQDISKFVDMIDRLVEALRRMLPNNPLLNPRYASSWWHKASAADTFFENLVSPHHRDPIFLTGGSEAPSRVAVASDQAASFIGDQDDDQAADDDTLSLDKLGAELDNVVAPYRKTLEKLFENIPGFDTDVASEGEDAMDETVRRNIDSLRDVITMVKDAEWRSLSGSGSNEVKLQRLMDEARAKALLAYILQEVGSLKDQTLEALSKFSATVIVPFVSLAEPLRLIQDYNVFSAAFGKGYRAIGAGRGATTKRSVLKSILQSINNISSTSARRGPRGPRSVVRARSSALQYGLGAKAKDYNRAPLTMSPDLFTSLYEYVQERNVPAIWPADPSNPDVVLSVSGFEERADIEGADIEGGGISATSLVSSEIGRHQLGELFQLDSFAAVRNLKQSSGVARDSISRGKTPRYSSIGGSMEVDEISTEFEGQRSRRSRHVSLSEVVSDHRATSRRMGVHYQDDGDDDEGEGSRAGERGRASSRARFAAGVEANLDEALTGKINHTSFMRLMNEVYDEATHPLVGSLGALFLTTPTNRRNFSSFIKNHLMFPMDFLIARPHARFQTYAVIKAQKGKETGTTFMGNSNFTLGDDPNTQTHVGTYTYWAKSVITKPINMYVARNVFVDGYDGGLGTTPYKRGTNSYKPGANVYGSTKRNTGSVFVLAVPRGGNRYPQQIDLSGRFRSWEIRYYGLDAEDEELHYVGAYYYNRYWGWSNDEVGLQSSMMASTYINEYAVPNSIMHEGHTMYFNPMCNSFNMVRISTGHYPSEYVYAGVKRAREGDMKEYKAQNWTTNYSNI